MKGRGTLTPPYKMCAYLYGYRYDDEKVVLPKIPPIKEGVKVFKDHMSSKKLPVEFMDRRPMSSNLGVSILGAAPTIPDKSDHNSRLAGFYYRVARAPPEPNTRLLRAAAKFVRQWCRVHIQQLDVNEDVSFETWLENANFPQTRKEEFKRARERLETKDFKLSKWKEVKGFTKEEDYKGDLKHFRCINARSDLFKVDVAGFFKQIEKKVFALPDFIKKIPNRDRAAYIMDKVYLPGAQYVCTDYTSFESGFRAKVMKSIEFEVYKYVGKTHPLFKDFWDKIQLLTRVNTIRYGGFRAKLPATRMSGEMNTSLGNGCFNLLAFKFACFLDGIETVGVVEGDDGLNRVTRMPNKNVFRDLGMILKYDVYENIGDASFCGQIFDPVAMECVRDPVQTMIKMGWSTMQYVGSNSITKKALLRSRALSAIYENPACPVLNRWCAMIMRLTSEKAVDQKMRELHRKERDTYIRDRNDQMYAFYDMTVGQTPRWEEVSTVPHIATRLLVEKRYGITVELQRWWEEIMDGMTELGVVDLPAFDIFIKNGNKIMYEEYQHNYEPRIYSRRLNTSYTRNTPEMMFALPTGHELSHFSMAAPIR